MKFTVMLKDPDTLNDAIDEAVDDEVDAMDLDEEEADALKEIRKEKTRSICAQWFDYGEYLSVEIDTTANTIQVVKS